LNPFDVEFTRNNDVRSTFRAPKKPRRVEVRGFLLLLWHYTATN